MAGPLREWARKAAEGGPKPASAKNERKYINMLKSEIIKINSKCQNNFSLDVFQAVCWKEKTLVKGIVLDTAISDKHENTAIIYKLSFDNVYEGKGWSAKKIGVAPFLHIERQNPLKGSSLASVTSVASAQIGETTGRKSLATLQKLTAKFTTEVCKRIYDAINGASVADGPRDIFALNDEEKNAQLAEALKTI